MKICGPKCSLCGLIISVWGIVQLVSVFSHVDLFGVVIENSHKTHSNDWHNSK